METLEIIPFKPLAAENPSFIWNVKCTFIACDNEDDENCKLDDACAGRYDPIKVSGNNPTRKRRSGDGKVSSSFTVEQKVEHPCVHASDHRSICDGNGENCWTEDVCKQTYSIENVLQAYSKLIPPTLATVDTTASPAIIPEEKALEDATTAAASAESSAVYSLSSALVIMSYFAQ